MTRYSLPPMITAQALGNIPAFSAEYCGVKSLYKALTEAGLPFRFRDHRDGYIPEHALATFINAIARATGQQNIGLVWAPFMTVLDYGAWGEFVLSAPTLGIALIRSQQALPYHATNNEISMELNGENAIFKYRFGLQNHPGYCDMALAAVGVILSIFRHYLGQHWSPALIGVNHKKPLDGENAETVFNCRVKWNCPDIFLEFPAYLLDKTALDKLCIAPRTIEDIARERANGPPDNFVGRVKSLIRMQLEEDGISIEKVGCSLNIGIRTLQRRLELEGTSFRKLGNQIRCQRARELLSLGQYSTTEISTMLGYNNSNNFSRAFRELVGMPPSQYAATCRQG